MQECIFRFPFTVKDSSVDTKDTATEESVLDTRDRPEENLKVKDNEVGGSEDDLFISILDK